MAESYSLEAILSARDTNFTSTMQSAQGAMGNMAKASSSFGSTMKGVISGLGVFKIASAAVGAVTGSIDNAISRVDTLENSARVFENMGYGAAETQSMMESLNDSILGLPTSLNDAVSGVQLLASSMGDIGKSQEVFSAMNNAILGFGGSAQMVDNAIIQLSQSFSNNKIDAQTWNSMINSGLGPALNALAKEMGYTTGELKTYLSDGTISVEEFQTALIDLDKNGGGGLKSLQQIAQDSTKGIATSLANARTSITRGVANIITAIDKGLSNAGLGSISDIITGIGKAAEKMLTGLAGGIETLGNFIAPLVAGFKSVMGPIGVATEALGAFQSATDELTSSVADVTSIFAEWDSLTLEEKQVTVSTMGQDEMEELLNLLGVDFDAIPDEYTKEAYLNAYGKDALEELLWVTGEWHNLTFEEKRAVLEAQIENDEIREAIDSMELWDDTEFYSKLADINMNDNDSGEQLLELINHYREVEGLEPLDIEVEANIKPAEKAINKFKSGFDSAGKTIGKVVKGIQGGISAMMTFFEPLKNIGKDFLNASVKAFSGYFKSFEKLVDGNWSDAWEIFKDTTVDSLGDVVNSIRMNVPKIWNNVKNLASNIWDSFRGINWGQVYSGISGFFTDIGSVLATVEWGVALGNFTGDITSLISEAFSYVEDKWGDGQLGELIGNVLINPESELNIQAGEFKDAIMTQLNAWAETAIFEILGVEIDLSEPLINFDEFNAGETLNNITTTIQGWFEDFTVSDLVIKLLPEFSWGDWGAKLSQEMAGIKEAIRLAWEEGDFSMLLGIEADAETELKRGAGREGLQAQIDEEYGEGAYQTLLDIEAVAETYAGQGFSESKIDELIKSTFPKDYDLYMEIKALPEISMDLDATSSLESQVNTAVAGGVSADVPINPTFDIQSGGVGTSTAGGAGAIDPPEIDFSGLIADAQSAMQTVNQTITSGMSNMASAVRIGTSMMNVAFRSGMNQAIVTAQNTVNRVVSAFSNLSSRLYSAGVMAGAGFRNGLASQTSSIISTAQSIANSVSSTIQSALRIASPSKVTTYLGEMVGAGLIAGMDGMVAGVESSANRLSLATLPTTDLGSSRYGGSISGQSTSSKLDEVIDAINRGQVIMLDSGTLVGETSRQMDVALGQQGSLGGRHRL